MATEDIGAPTRLYQVEGVEVLAETAELKVSVFAFGPGQEIPWHSHSEIDDIFVCLAGRLRIEAREPAETVSLAPGERHTMPAGRAHRVSGDEGRCEYLIVQGVGSYDFKPVE